MSQSKNKAIRAGYKQAGAIYWTQDMETIIRKIRADRYAWMTAAIVEACLAFYFAMQLYK
jgi:hypothetical protein